MFRCCQKFTPPGYCSVTLAISQNMPNGKRNTVLADPTEDVLPPVENYDLGAMLEAGVPLEQVDTRLFSSNSIPSSLVDSLIAEANPPPVAEPVETELPKTEPTPIEGN